MGEVQGNYSGGIAGNVNNMTDNEISNCFNVGKISKEADRFQISGGIICQIIGGATININNCYNIAILSRGHSSNNIGGIIGIVNNGTVTMNKCYYLKQDDTKTAIGWREDDVNQVTACDAISEITATILNNNISNIEHMDEWQSWKIGEDGYPIFE